MKILRTLTMATFLVVATVPAHADYSNEARSSCLTRDIAQTTGAAGGAGLAGGAAYGGTLAACAAATGGACLIVGGVVMVGATILGAIFGSEAGKKAGGYFCDEH